MASWRHIRYFSALGDDDARNFLLRRTLAYARPRIDYYIDVLQHEFHPHDQTRSQPLSSLATFILLNKDRTNTSPWSHEPWKQDQRPIEPIEAEAEAEEDDAQSLSCEGKHDEQEEIEGNAEAMFQKALQFCRSPVPVSEQRLAELIESTYTFQKDLRSQMALGSCFTRYFPDRIKSAARARRALLFLCRLHAAVSTFISAAKVLSSFRRISFPAFGTHTKSSQVAEIRICTFADALKKLGPANTIYSMKDRFVRRNRSMEDANILFNKLRCESCRVHAEVQLIHEYESRQANRAELDGCIPTSEAASYAVIFARHLSAGMVFSLIEAVIGKFIIDGWSRRLLRRRKRPASLNRPFAASSKK